MTIINNTDEILKIGLLVIMPRTSKIVTKENFSQIIDKYPEVETGFIKGQIIAIDDGTTPQIEIDSDTVYEEGTGPIIKYAGQKWRIIMTAPGVFGIEGPL